MSTLVIKGKQALSGSISVKGSKNAALPLLACSLLTKKKVTIKNVPQIADVHNLVEILQNIGVKIIAKGDSVQLEAQEIDIEGIANDKVGLLRGSVLLMGPLLGRLKYVRLPHPGGDIIGARPIDTHLDAFRQLGASIIEKGDEVIVDGSNIKAGKVVMREFSVTATENILMLAAITPGLTTINIAAAEPHVAALAQILRKMGAKISGEGTHTIKIEGRSELKGAFFTNIPDMLEAGFFILTAAATKSEVVVKCVPINDLLLFFKKLDEIGINYKIDNSQQSVSVSPSKLRGVSLQTMPHPGLATDLQAPFSVVATQATGSTLIHDPMYEDRFKHISELKKMGAKAVVCDPHRVIVEGPTPLRGREMASLDIRSGATMILAGLIASGETIIHDAEIINRGYEKLAERLKEIGANIVSHHPKIT